MVTVGIEEIVSGLIEANFLWLLIPIFFGGIIADKYQEEHKTSIGNAISNGTMIIFSAFSWLQLILSRQNFPIDVTISQLLLSFIITVYGFSIIASGFGTGKFAQVYGRIRVITFMLMFFTIIIYVPILYNFVSILLFVFLFPFYYAFITELIKILPELGGKQIHVKIEARNYISNQNKTLFRIGKEKLNEYFLEP
jgi:predicted MFS family arabinose efflux permease